MTRDEAKKELRPLKDISRDIKAVMDEIERLETVATKMTPNYDITPISGTPKNKMEEAIVKLEDYRSRLSGLVVDTIDYRDRCRSKIEKIEPRSLQTLLNLYYIQDNTLEKTAEIMGKSVRWTYEMFITALDKYSEVF